jgi:hypothetical protein
VIVHLRRQFIDAAKAAVRGTASVGSSVFEWNGRAIEGKHKRWIAVIPRSESPADDTSQSEQSVTFAFDFVAGARTGEARDEVSLQMQAAIARSPLFSAAEWTGTTLSDPDVEGNDHIFEAVHSYTIQYRHAYESPGTEVPD